MNERIKEIAKSAGFFPELNWDHTGWHAAGHDDTFEKFAKLIVRECAEIALEQKKWVEDQQVFNPRDKEWNLARIQQSQRIVDKIKEHFGVE